MSSKINCNHLQQRHPGQACGWPVTHPELQLRNSQPDHGSCSGISSHAEVLIQPDHQALANWPENLAWKLSAARLRPRLLQASSPVQEASNPFLDERFPPVPGFSSIDARSFNTFDILAKG
jgi:hypothetical protein